MRGRQFGFLGALAAAWIASRIAIGAIEPEPQRLNVIPASPTLMPMQYRSTALPMAVPGNTVTQKRQTASPNLVSGFQSPVPNRHRFDVTNLPKPPETSSSNLMDQQQKKLRFQMTETHAPPQRSRSPNVRFYGYSFFRGQSGNNVLGTGGQYGGSQSGFAATWALSKPISPNAEPAIALLARGAIAHKQPEERELAAGLRLRPLPKVPVSLTLEHRLRNGQKDASALYLAGGHAVNLAQHFRLEGFAQAGLVSGKANGHFFDLMLRSDRKLATIGRNPVRAGVGVWGGGQAGIFRIDAGPTVSNDITLSRAHVRISADWRFRIAGDAAPASGPAMTLSTSF